MPNVEEPNKAELKASLESANARIAELESGVVPSPAAAPSAPWLGRRDVNYTQPHYVVKMRIAKTRGKPIIAEGVIKGVTFKGGYGVTNDRDAAYKALNLGYGGAITGYNEDKKPKPVEA